MKKLFSAVLLVTMLATTACARNEQIIEFGQLPAEAQTLVQTYFPQEEISFVVKDKEGLSVEYEVRFASGAKVEFNKAGELKKVDCGLLAVPEGLVPEAVRTYVSAKFPKEYITEWQKDGRRWKAELSSGLDLVFDKSYNFVGIDD